MQTELPKTLNTYLGQKGYTILKKELSLKQQHNIRTELTAKPYTPGSPCAGNQTHTFPVYRESNNKFYIPRYYGETHFGKPKESKISEGKLLEGVDTSYQ